MAARGYDKLDLVVCNLYPFQKRVADPAITLEDAVEEVDIGKALAMHVPTATRVICTLPRRFSQRVRCRRGYAAAGGRQEPRARDRGGRPGRL
jgi:hypothetical protein